MESDVISGTDTTEGAVIFCGAYVLHQCAAHLAFVVNLSEPLDVCRQRVCKWSKRFQTPSM